MGGATTRGRKKATAAEADELTAEAPAAQWGELQSRVGQLTVSLAVAEEKRVAFEAETRQALTEVRFELRNPEPWLSELSELSELSGALSEHYRSTIG